MKKLGMLVIVLIVLSTVFAVPLARAEAATIWTDKDSYGPEETVTIFGSGFLANANVTIAIEAPDSSVDTIYRLTDDSGSFTAQYALDGMEGEYVVTATDGTNRAITIFAEPVVILYYFTAAILPTTAYALETETYTITITNDLSSTYRIRSAKVTVPSGFTSISGISVSPPPGKTWTATFVSGEIRLFMVVAPWPAQWDYSRLEAGQSVSVTFSATAPATLGTYEFTTRAYLDIVWPSFEFIRLGDQPTVTVTEAPGSTQYSLTVQTDPVSIVTIPGEGLYDENTPVTLTAPSTVAVSDGVQWRFDHWDVDGSTVSGNPITVTMDAPHTATAHYVKQYYLTVSSTYDTPGGEDWYDEKTNAYATLATGTVSGGVGTQYVFTGWSGDASGTGLTSNAIYMDGPKTATANWKTQYYLTVKTNPLGIAAISGEGWYDENTPVTLTAPSLVSVSPGVRYRFDHWDVDGTSQGAGINPITVTMNGPRTATAHYVKQYYLTVQTNPVSIATIPGEGWYDESTPVQLTAPAGPCIAPNGYQYFFAEWTSQGNGVNPITVQMDGPHTATANYVTPQTLGFSWTGPAKVKKGSTATYTAVYTITANVPLTNVKVQGGIGAKAKNLKIYLDGKLVDELGSLTSKDWTTYKDGTPFPAGITLKLDVSKINNVFVLRISSMAAGESHQLSITFDWTFTSTGAEKITDSWTATCTSTFGTTTTPNTNKIMVKVS